MPTQEQKICQNSSSLDNSSKKKFSRALRSKTLITTTALLSFLGAWLCNPNIQAIKNPTPVVELYKQPAATNADTNAAINIKNRFSNIKVSFSKPAYANETSQYFKANQQLSEAEIIKIIQPILDSRAPSGKRPVLEKEIKASKVILQQGLELEQIVKQMQQPVEKTLKYSDIVYLTRDANGNDLDIYNHSDLKKINENYKKQVWKSDKPVLVMFYAGDRGKPGDVMDPDSGLASVYKHIQEKFGDEIKFCAYKVSDDYYLDRGIKPFIRESYGAKTVPAILFYDNDRGEIELEESASKGPGSLHRWIRQYKAIAEYIPKNTLD